ncbi:beta propeller repeat protein [Natronococcus jeotgali]|uniref:Photosynthesis system II assembly factor Ycf48/Hcf136-like domain-containing protein n=1 Tax=Natronococcus jeotgali DSM 18795 TaxID=1227498 RepID=L9X7S4_9EURY|nr:hypothetical protein [Natronococcus jeotgali]ELY57814.1 hypothetical protein C492_12869 [Natronococcus jeotgali DSM 18795]
MSTATADESFGAFFRRYTKTWMHAIATTGLTAFGMLTFIHRGFAILALACYVVPPIVLYLSRRGDGSADDAPSPTEAALSDREGSDGRDATAERSATASGTDSLGPPPAEPDAGVERTDRAERDASESRATSARPSPSSGPEREPTAEPERSTDAEADAGPPDSGGAEPGADSVPDDAEPKSESTAAPSGSEPDAEPEWRPADAPTEATLRDAAITTSGAVAVGEGGVVASTDGEEWSVLLEDGPAAQGQALSGVDATDDGAIVWVAGDGGAVGRLEVESGRHVDYSAPDDRTDNLAGIAVAGGDGEETVLLINGSGEVLRGHYRDGDCRWDEPVTPGGGSSLSDVVLAGAVGYCCDTNDGVFATDDGGRSFERIGIEDADGTPVGIAAEGDEEGCHLCTDAGVVHRYDGSRWTPERVCEDALAGIDGVGARLAVCTADGAIHEREDPTADWERADADAPAGLEEVALGDDLGVAVGGEGTVLERR